MWELCRCNSGAVDFKEILDHYYREYARGVVSRMHAYYGGKPIVYSSCFVFSCMFVGLLCCGLVNFIV